MKQTKELYVVGIGPGAYEEMTIRASNSLHACDIIIGYTVYVDLIKEHFPDKEYKTTPMKQETQRCEMALRAADAGKKCAVICSGDCGIYGMAGLIFELSPKYPEVTIHIVPGITAASGGGAILGAAIGHDFAVISLSDLLTPWEEIANRLRHAALSDFAIVIYNPSSRNRSDYLRKACEIIMEYQSPETICGVVKNIAREGQESEVLYLKDIKERQTDMFTTVFIGNSKTKLIEGKMVTPRGYQYA